MKEYHGDTESTEVHGDSLRLKKFKGERLKEKVSSAPAYEGQKAMPGKCRIKLLNFCCSIYI